MREIELALDDTQRENVRRSLWRREFRQFQEGRQASLFCYGMSRAVDRKIEFALVEDEDFDLIARYVTDDILNYVPVQLKQLVPSEVNERSTLQDELNKLSKYVDSKGLVVAFHLNRDTKLDLNALNIPELMIKELWFFWAAEPEQQRWTLLGNLLNSRYRHYDFQYPEIA